MYYHEAHVHLLGGDEELLADGAADGPLGGVGAGGGAGKSRCRTSSNRPLRCGITQSLTRTTCGVTCAETKRVHHREGVEKRDADGDDAAGDERDEAVHHHPSACSKPQAHRSATQCPRSPYQQQLDTKRIYEQLFQEVGRVRNGLSHEVPRCHGDPC